VADGTSDKLHLTRRSSAFKIIRVVSSSPTCVASTPSRCARVLPAGLELAWPDQVPPRGVGV